MGIVPPTHPLDDVRSSAPSFGHMYNWRFLFNIYFHLADCVCRRGAQPRATRNKKKKNIASQRSRAAGVDEACTQSDHREGFNAWHTVLLYALAIDSSTQQLRSCIPTFRIPPSNCKSTVQVLGLLVAMFGNLRLNAICKRVPLSLRSFAFLGGSASTNASERSEAAPPLGWIPTDGQIEPAPQDEAMAAETRARGRS